MDKIRVLVVDDHDLFREGVRSLLKPYEDIEIVGEAANGKEAVAEASRLTPDVVLMDIAMPIMNGLEATRRICKENSRVKVLALTQYDDSDYVLSILKAGASGYITKRTSAAELYSAIKATHAGQSFLHPSAAAPLVQDYLRRVSVANNQDPYERLTDREREVLQLVAEGRTTREIASMLVLSVKTVMRHRMSISQKLEIHNRSELVKFAMRHGLIEAPTRLEN